MLSIIIIIVILIAIILWLISGYNSLISSRNQVNRAFSDMDVYLQKRYQLVPNLVATAQKLTDQEQAIFDKITNARAAIGGARNIGDRLQNEDALSQAIHGFLSYTEQNPQFMSQQGLSQFSDSLREIDAQIRNSQQFYNGAVLKFDNQSQTFPSNLIANLFKISSMPYFKADDQQRENVNVQFK